MFERRMAFVCGLLFAAGCSTGSEREIGKTNDHEPGGAASEVEAATETRAETGENAAASPEAGVVAEPSGVSCPACVAYSVGPLLEVEALAAAEEVSEWVAVLDDTASVSHVPVAAAGEQANRKAWSPGASRLALGLQGADGISRVSIAEFTGERGKEFTRYDLAIPLEPGESVTAFAWLDDTHLLSTLSSADGNGLSSYLADVSAETRNTTFESGARGTRLNGLHGYDVHVLAKGAGALAPLSDGTDSSAGAPTCSWSRLKFDRKLEVVPLVAAPCPSAPQSSADGRFVMFYRTVVVGEQSYSQPVLFDASSGEQLALELPVDDVMRFAWGTTGAAFGVSSSRWIPQGDFGYSVGELFIGDASTQSLRRPQGDPNDRSKAFPQELVGVLDSSSLIGRQLGTPARSMVVPLDPALALLDLGEVPLNVLIRDGKLIGRENYALTLVDTSTAPGATLVLNHELALSERILPDPRCNAHVVWYTTETVEGTRSLRNHYLTSLDSERAAVRLDIPSEAVAVDLGWTAAPEGLVLGVPSVAATGALYWIDASSAQVVVLQENARAIAVP